MQINKEVPRSKLLISLGTEVEVQAFMSLIISSKAMIAEERSIQIRLIRAYEELNHDGGR